VRRETSDEIALLKFFYPEEIIAFTFSLAIIIAQLVLILNPPEAGKLESTSLVLPLVAFGYFLSFVISTSKGDASKKWVVFMRSYLHIPFYGIIFLSFQKIVHIINPYDWDSFLLKADLTIFRADVTVLLEKLNSRFLTEILTLCYFSYYILPTVSAVVFFTMKNSESSVLRLRKFILAIVIGWYFAFVFYLILPATGPDFAFPEHYHTQLVGLTSLSDAYLKSVSSYISESNVRNTFPSMHFAILLMINYFAYKWKRKYFLFCTLPLGIGLGIATLYLRQHYLIDLGVAIPVAFGCIYLSRRLLNEAYKR
jgi:PAP2 superfamily protein